MSGRLTRPSPWPSPSHSRGALRGPVQRDPEVPGPAHRNVLRARTLESWSATTTHLVAIGPVDPDDGVAHRTSRGSLARRALRFPSLQLTPSPVVMNVILSPMGHQARQAQDRDVLPCRPSVQNVFLCRDLLDHADAPIRAQTVRGHEKVPAGGQVRVPGFGQIEVSTLRSSCRTSCEALVVTVAVPTSHITTQGTPLKNARERMDVIAAYREVGSYRGAAAICGTTHKTVKRIIKQHEAGDLAVDRTPRTRNYDEVTDLVAERVKATAGRISAKRLLPEARPAGYVGVAPELSPSGRGGQERGATTTGGVDVPRSGLPERR
jgi:hypothetical protein